MEEVDCKLQLVCWKSDVECDPGETRPLRQSHNSHIWAGGAKEGLDYLFIARTPRSPFSYNHHLCNHPHYHNRPIRPVRPVRPIRPVGTFLQR